MELWLTQWRAEAAGSGVRNCRTVETRSLLSAFDTTCRTPTFWASNSICGDQCMVCISMGISGRSLEICRAALRPSITGITRSRMMRLGLSSWALASASRPFSTSTISQGPALCSRLRKAVLTTGLSSAISILGMLSGTQVETGGRYPVDSFSASRFDALRRYHEPRCLTYGKLCITYRASTAGLRHSASRKLKFLASNGLENELFKMRRNL